MKKWTLKKKLIWLGISIVSVIMLIITLGKLNLRGKFTRYSPPPDEKELEAIKKQTDAIVERAKAEAVGEEKVKQIDDIMKEDDARVRLERLSEAMKDL